jgi:hypothetical protein
MKHVTEIPEGCDAALVVATRPTDDSHTVQILKWQPIGEPNAAAQLALLFGGVMSVLDELEDGGRFEAVDRIENMIATHSVKQLVDIFRA